MTDENKETNEQVEQSSKDVNTELPSIPAADKPNLDPDKEAERAAKITAAKAKAEAAKAVRTAAANTPTSATTSSEEGAEKPKPKPAAKKEVAPTVIPIANDPLINAIKDKFLDSILEAVLINNQQVVRVASDSVHHVLSYLKKEAEPAFNFLTDLTAVHYTEKGFEVIYQLYAVNEMKRLRIKTEIADGMKIPTVTNLWSTANWLEREVYDLFGITFDGHPDLRRILLPDGWVGFPLRKDYPLEYEDNEWVNKNLNILEIPSDADLTGKFE